MADYTEPRFAELPEAEARGSIKEIYDDIRGQLRAPMVNLVYRHMATEPGCLEWAWAGLRPIFASGAVGDAATALTAGVDFGEAAPIPRNAGVDDESLGVAQAVIESYNRANPMNLIALGVLDLALSEGSTDDAVPPARSIPELSAPAMPLPPLVDPESVDEMTAGLLRRVSRQGTGGDTGVVPSVYRHLAHWPGLLALIADATDTQFHRIDVDGAATKLGDRAVAAARALPRPATGLAPPDAAQAKSIRALIDFFPPMICRMVVIGAYLRDALAR